MSVRALSRIGLWFTLTIPVLLHQAIRKREVHGWALSHWLPTPDNHLVHVSRTVLALAGSFKLPLDRHCGIVSLIYDGSILECTSDDSPADKRDNPPVTTAWSAQYCCSSGDYLYEYIIHVDSSGAGKVKMVPDYPSEGVPVWTESFTVEPAALDEFYRQLVAAGAFSVQWREADQPPVGGSHFFTTLTAHGQTVTIPGFVVARQATA